MSAHLATDAVAHRRTGDARVARAKAPRPGDSPHVSRPRRVRLRPRALVMRAPGTNCDRETVIALEMAGADVESVHLERLLAAARDLDEFGLVVLPGGFSFGDHLGAGALWAHRLEAVRQLSTGSSKAASRCLVSATASRRCSGSGCSLAVDSPRTPRVTSNAAGSGCGVRKTRGVRSLTASIASRCRSAMAKGGSSPAKTRPARRGWKRAARSASSIATRMGIVVVTQSIQMAPMGRSRH